MKKKFARRIDALPEVFELAQAFLEREELDASLRFALEFSLEELFTNLVKYNPGNPNEIQIELRRQDDGVEASITDYDVDAFDVTTTDPVDVNQSLEERRVGGLGLHLVRSMVDHLDYRYEDRCSTITFSKSPAG